MQGRDLKAAQVIAQRAAERASKLADAPWIDRALGVVSALSADVHAYVAASKHLFGLLVPTAADRTAAHRSLQRVSHFTKNTAVCAMNGIVQLRVAYKKDGVSGLRNWVERLASAVLDQVVPLPNTVAPSPEVSEQSDLPSTSRKLLSIDDVAEEYPESNVEAFSDMFDEEEPFEYEAVSATPNPGRAEDNSRGPTGSETDNLAARVRRDLSDAASKAEKKARDGVSVASARFKDASERFKHASMRFKDKTQELKEAAKENARLSRERIKAAVGDASSRFKDACDIDAIPVSSNTKPWVVVFVLLFVLLLIAAFVWMILDKRKRQLRRSPSRNAPPVVAVDENNETQSLLDEDEEPPEESEDAENDDDEQEHKEEGKWYEESAGEEEEEESNEYFERKYGSESSTNSDSPYRSAGLPKDMKIRYGT